MAVSIHEGDGSVPGQSFAMPGKEGSPSLSAVFLLFPLSRRRLGERERERAKVAPGAGRPSRVMRVDRVEGATWEEAMPPLAPSDRSPTATPRLNCSSAIRLSKCHRELNFSLLPRTTFKSRFDKQIKWLVPWTTIIISLSDDDEIFL